MGIVNLLRIVNQLFNHDDDDFDTDLDNDFDADSDDDDIDGEDGDQDMMETSGELSFTGLINGGLTDSTAYASWQDGISPDEIMPDDIQEVANHIAEEFSQAFPEVEMEMFSGGFATTMQGNGTIFYDIADVMQNSGMGFGADNIVGSIAHEMGHNIVERVFSDSGLELSRLQHEIGADYIEGVTFGLTGINPQEKYDFLRSVDGYDPDYLPAAGRIDVIERGIEWGERLRFVGKHMPEALINFSSNEMLQGVLKRVMSIYTDMG